MRKIENIFISSIAILCMLYIYFSFQMRLGTMKRPGGGFVPVIFGIMGLAVSLSLLVINFKKSEKEDGVKLQREDMLRFFGYLAICILFIPAMWFFGSSIAIFAVVLSMTKISGSKRWIFSVFLAVAVSVLSYVVFNILLGVQLPMGTIFL